MAGIGWDFLLSSTKGGIEDRRMRWFATVFAMMIPGFSKAVEFSAHEWVAPNGFTVRYRLVEPKKVEEGKVYPVILFMHGLGERGTDNEQQLKHGARSIAEVAEKLGEPVYLIAPQCPPDRWWSPVDEKKTLLTAGKEPNQATEGVLALVADFSAKHPVDAKRFYVTGLSMGGFATWDMLGRAPERIAAAMPVCGGGDVDLVERYKDVPIRTYHGDADEVVPLAASERMIAALEAAGAKPGFIVYPGVRHDSWTRTYADPEALKWLLSQRKR